jgi:hypothetical protein
MSCDQKAAPCTSLTWGEMPRPSKLVAERRTRIVDARADFIAISERLPPLNWTQKLARGRNSFEARKIATAHGVADNTNLLQHFCRCAIINLARPHLRPARCKDLRVALGAAPIGEAASLLRDRNFVKGPGHRLRVISILRLDF